MTDTWRRAIGALLLIASMGTSTCVALWNVRGDSPLPDLSQKVEQGR